MKHTTKRISALLLALTLLLCGCAAEETLETVSDDIIQPVIKT